MIIAVGRVCIDSYLSLINSSNRIGSTKKAAVSLGNRLGGSIYNSLLMASRWGERCYLLTVGSLSDLSTDFCINSDLLTISSVPKGHLAESIILFEGNTLNSIISIAEDTLLKINKKDVIDFINNLHDPINENDVVMVDLRHEEASYQLANIAHNLGALVMLDPGSTVYLADYNLNSRFCRVIEMCDVIIASSDFYSRFGNVKRFDELFQLPVFNNCSLLICTLNSGINLVATKQFIFSIVRNETITVGNTIGAGDVFRGVFAALLHDSINAGKKLGKMILIDIIKTSIAAATIKIEDKSLFLNFPDKQLILQRRKSMEFIINDDTEKLVWGD